MVSFWARLRLGLMLVLGLGLGLELVIRVSNLILEYPV